MKGAKPISGRPGESIPPVDFDKLKEKLIDDHYEKGGLPITDKTVMSAALYPQVITPPMHTWYINNLITLYFPLMGVTSSGQGRTLRSGKSGGPQT